MNNGELRELVHLLLMCGIMDKTATESGNVTDEEWLRMKNLIKQYQTEGGINCEPDKSGDLISREALKKKLQARHDNGEEDFDKGYNIGIETAIDLIDNAPTVTQDCSDCKRFDFPYFEVKFDKEQMQELVDKAKAEVLASIERPQGELVEKLKDRIEESICKRCPMNNKCVFCEISRVFQIITLTAEEQKGGTEA